MTPRIAARMLAIEPFHVMEILTRAHELEAAGCDIVHMEVGEPDFATPQPILEAGIEALRSCDIHYTPACGLARLREAISGYYRERFGVSVPASRIVVTAGASGALLLVMGVLLNPGDAVLMADPGYPCNAQFVRVMGGVPRCIQVGPESAYQLTPQQVEANWTADTVALLVASPSNPTGTLAPRGDLETMAQLAEARGGWLIVDEIYLGLTYGVEATSAAAFSDQVFVVQSFSKYFSMTGWRLGWLVAPEDYVREVEKLAQHLFISPSAVAQYAALAAFRPDTLAIAEARRTEFQARRDFLLPALSALGFDFPVTPQGAFYLYADVARLTRDSHAFCLDVLERAGVAITPGLDFGARQPERHVRFAYTTSIERLREGVRRLAAYLER